MPVSKEVEQSLASIVYTNLQDTLPGLTKYLIGFQLIETNPENTKNLGMCAFNINNKYYYLPCFFINGFLKPLVLLLDVKKQKFIPAIKPVIDHITKPQTNTGMSVIPQDKYSDVLSRPNLAETTLPPVFSKIGSKSKFVQRLLQKDPMTKKAFAEAFKKAQSILDYFPEILDALKPQEEPVKEEVLIVIEEPSKTLSVKDNQEILSKGFCVKDFRTSFNPVQMPGYQQYTTPIKSGMYQVLNSAGSWVKKIFLKNPIRFSGNEEPTGLLIDCCTMVCDVVNPNMVISKPLPCHDEAFEIKSLPEESDDTAIILMTHNSCTLPLKVKNKVLAASGSYSMLVQDTNYDCFKVIVNPFGMCHMTVCPEEKELIVSKDIKILTVRLPECGCSADLGTHLDLKYSQSFMVENDPGRGVMRVYENNKMEKEGSYKDCFIHLLKNKRLSQDTVKEILHKSATSVNPVEFPYLDIQQRKVPMSGKPRNNNLMLHPIKPNEEVPATPVLFRGGTTPEIDIMLAQQAAKLGDDEILDTTLLGLMAKNDNSVENLKQDLPVFLSATHRLGALLFQLWWYPEIFLKDYTTEELYHMEQTVMNLFKNFGELIMDINSKHKLYQE